MDTHPINDDALPAHVLASRTRQPDDRPCKIGTLTPPPCRNPLRDLPQPDLVLPEPIVHLRLHIPRTHAIDVDVVLRPLVRERLRQLPDPALRGRVRGHGEPALEGEERAEEDDFAVRRLGREHMLPCRFGEVERGREVNVDHLDSEKQVKGGGEWYVRSF